MTTAAPKVGAGSERWSARSVALHWVSAGLVVGLASAGLLMPDLPPDSSSRLLLSRLHTVFGLTLMALTAVRLVVRWRGKSPTPLPLPPLHRRGVSLVHGSIYATLFAMGGTGVFTAIRSAWPSYLGGDGHAPDLSHVASRELHEVLFFVLLVLIALHVGGVVVQEARTGGTLRRMIPIWRTSRSSTHAPPQVRQP